MNLTRRNARILAMEALFSWEISKIPEDRLLQFLWVEDKKLQRYPETELIFPRLLISGTLEHIDEIDQKIISHLRGWEFSRINNVDKAILRFSIYSLMFQPDIPYSVVIDEAVNIAHDYGDDNSFKFVNGVLESIKNELYPAENTQ